MRVVKATKEDLDRAVDLAYSMQSNVETRCRNLLIDATKEAFYSKFNTYLEREEHDILLVEEEGKLVGLTPMYWMTDDQYVSYDQGPYGYDYQAVSDCLYDYIVEHYKGYKFYTNTAQEHVKSIEFFESKGFDKIEEAVLMKLEDFKSDHTNPLIEKLNEKNASTLYEWIEKNIDEDTYWNSTRIRENLDRFIILGYFDQGLKGHIIGRGSSQYTEVIAFTGDDDVKEALFKSFITASYENNVTSIDLYTEEDDEAALGKKYGFEMYDNNVCFLKHL